MGTSNQKIGRVLDIFYRILKGEDISVSRIASEYDVSNKSISRDINEIKNFLADNRELVGNSELQYNYQSRTYHLVDDHFLSNKELVTIVKILIGSRSLNKMELLNIISKLRTYTTSQDRKMLEVMIQKDIYHYREVHHDCISLIENIWQLVRIIDKQQEITITYYKQNRNKVERRLKPIDLVFSEYYFYLVAYKENGASPYYFRVDRIIKIIEHRKNFKIDEVFYFDVGPLTEKIQYMYPGIYRRIKFEFNGSSLQAILDRIPTAKVINVEGDRKIIEAYIYSDGIKMFLLSQGRYVRVIEPQEFVDEIKEEVKEVYSSYYKE